MVKIISGLKYFKKMILLTDMAMYSSVIVWHTAVVTK